MADKPWTILHYIQAQIRWSLRTFKTGRQNINLIDDIQKKLDEIKNSPGDLMKWIDIIILGLDGAWRNGHTPVDIIKALRERQLTNIKRNWSDYQKTTDHIQNYIICTVCGEWYKAEPDQCSVCGEEIEFTQYDITISN